MTNRFWPSAFVAALFAIHPLRVESVAWVTERKDVLSGLFFMLTLLAYVGYARRRFSLVRYALVAVLFTLGLMAKPMLVTLPFVLLLLDYWPLGRMASQGRSEERLGSNWLAPAHVPVPMRLVIEKIPLFVLAGGDCLATMFVQGDSHGDQRATAALLAHRQCRDLIRHLPGQVLLPGQSRHCVSSSGS